VDRNPFSEALRLILASDADLLRVVGLSLRVTLSAVLAAALIGLPLGALLAVTRGRLRDAIAVLLNAMMGLPPVVAGLALYLLLSRSGPLGALGWLFTPAAMIAAQALLVTPIVASLTRQTIEDLWRSYEEGLTALGSTRLRALPTLLFDARHSLATALLAGFGRASAEVGAVLIVGGNIAGYTRTMTTTIALETSKGDLELALALGVILIALTIAINAAAFGVSTLARRAGA
jgi:tungstate transport system permease protein